MQVTYLAHDLDDPSCWRRVEMLRRGGATVRIAGFRRGAGPLPGPATVLGHTANGRLLQRVQAILAAAPRIARLVPEPAAPQAGAPAETILARNLEMLALGAALLRHRRRNGIEARLVYELLDIHGMMLGQGAVHRALRRIEAALMRRAGLVVLSSPAFASRYLEPWGQPAIPTLLVENKPFAPEGPDHTGAGQGAPSGPSPGIDEPAAPPPVRAAGIPAPADGAFGRPLVIGWFGMLRCAWSLHTLDTVTRADPGRFRVVLRGRPALDVIPDFHAVIAANPDLVFEGAYRWPDDLPAIYGAIDLAWLIDRYQAGANSDWLLPNRLYEGCLNGAVPVVLDGTEVARRTAAWGCGLPVPEPEAPSVGAVLAGLAPARLADLQAAVAAIPRSALQMDRDECGRLTRAICGLDAPAPVAVGPVADGAAQGSRPASSAGLAEATAAARKRAADTDHAAALTAVAPGQGAASSDASAPRVLVVIPTLNEAAHIDAVLDSILPFAGRTGGRVVVADGGSTDATRAIVAARAARDPRVVLLDNPRRLQAAAINRAVEIHGDGFDWLLRLDAHSAYPADFGDALLAEAAETGADSVVVSMEAEGRGALQRLIADAQNSRIGNGGSAHRLAGRGAWVDHGHHALMRLAAFRAVGGYDERFSHNEDAELDHRLRRAGYRIRLTGRTGLRYFPRARLGPLLRQYFNFGRGRARNLAKHRGRPALRQRLVALLAPALLLALLIPLGTVFALPLLLWLAACVAGGVLIALSTRNPAGLVAGFIAGAMHLAWSAGYWRERLAPALAKGGAA